MRISIILLIAIFQIANAQTQEAPNHGASEKKAQRSPSSLQARPSNDLDWTRNPRALPSRDAPKPTYLGPWRLTNPGELELFDAASIR